jgi:hypothetical protein
MIESTSRVGEFVIRLKKDDGTPVRDLCFGYDFIDVAQVAAMGLGGVFQKNS